MEEHTEVFIALGAAAAANCGPCFEHYFAKAEKLGIHREEIQKTIDIAVRVRGGAQMVVNAAIKKRMSQQDVKSEDCCDGTSPCCG